jgi:hypothetical protein
VPSPVEEGVATGQPVDLTGATDRDVPADLLRELVAAGAPGLRLTGARVVGPLDLGGLRIGGPVRLVGCDFTAPLSLRDADLPLLDLRRSRLVSLTATEAVVERVLLLSGIEATAGVALGGARVGATCTLQSARLRCADGPALVADRMRLASDLLLDRLDAEGTGPRGAVRLQGTRLDGRLTGHGLRIANPDGPALVADNLQVAGPVYLSEGAELRGAGERGAVRMAGARVGSLSFGGARIENPAGWALAAHYLDCGGTVYLDGLRATGGVRITGARIGGRLDCAGATVEAPDGSALDAGRSAVGQGIDLRGATLRGRTSGPAALQLRGVTCGADLDVRDTRLANPDGVAVRVAQATVAGVTWLEAIELESGGIDLRDAQLSVLRDRGLALPPGSRLILDGLTYRGLPGATAGSPPLVRDRIRWLERMDGYAAQPYRQLAAAYQAAGHPDDARRVLVAQQEHLRRSGRLTSRWSRLRHRLFGWTLQYGYQPLRAVALLAATLAAAAVVFGLGATGTRAVPAGGPCPVVDRVGLAIDAAVPLVSTGARDRCRLATGTATGQRLAVGGWVLTLLGWGSATLVVAGYTGLVRRP